MGVEFREIWPDKLSALSPRGLGLGRSSGLVGEASSWCFAGHARLKR